MTKEKWHPQDIASSATRRPRHGMDGGENGHEKGLSTLRRGAGLL